MRTPGDAVRPVRCGFMKRLCLKNDGSQILSDLRFHDLRREATSRLFEKGLGIMEVASMTGHKTLSMLRVYTKMDAERLAAKLG